MLEEWFKLCRKKDQLELFRVFKEYCLVSDYQDIDDKLVILIEGNHILNSNIDD